MAQPAPVGSPRAQSQSIRKGVHGTQWGRRGRGRMVGKREDPIMLAPLACGVPCSIRAVKETREALGDPDLATSALGLSPPLNSLPIPPRPPIFANTLSA